MAVKVKRRVVREKKIETVERVKKDPPLFDKPKQYKVGDKVVVDFLNTQYVCSITQLRFKEDFSPKRWTYYCIVDAPEWAKGWKFPNVGIGRSEEDFNIVSKIK